MSCSTPHGVADVVTELCTTQNLAVSLTLAFNQFVNPWALDALGWKYVSHLHGHPSGNHSQVSSPVSRLSWVAHHRTCLHRRICHRDERQLLFLCSTEIVTEFNSRDTGRTLEETAALFDGEQQPQVLMQTGGEAATLSMNVVARGPGIRIEQEKSTVTDVVELRTSGSMSSRSPRHISDRMMSHTQTTSMSRYDEEDEQSDDSGSRIVCEAV